MKLRYVFVLFIAFNAAAEKADRSKPTTAKADMLTYDEVNKTPVNILEGNVVITQGTLVIKADKLFVKGEKEGERLFEAFGKPLVLRQKREGREEYIETESERLELDERVDTIKLFTNIHVKSGKNEVRGEYMTYNSVTESYQLRSAIPGDAASNKTKQVEALLYKQDKVEEKSVSRPNTESALKP